jgi:hypothetical protein
MAFFPDMTPPATKEQADKSLESAPTVLGDKKSMKAMDKAKVEVPKNDKPNAKDGKNDTPKKKKTLKETVEQDPTAIGDPVSLKVGTDGSKPVGNDQDAEIKGGVDKKGSKL